MPKWSTGSPTLTWSAQPTSLGPQFFRAAYLSGAAAFPSRALFCSDSCLLNCPEYGENVFAQTLVILKSDDSTRKCHRT